MNIKDKHLIIKLLINCNFSLIEILNDSWRWQRMNKFDDSNYYYLPVKINNKYCNFNNYKIRKRNTLSIKNILFEIKTSYIKNNIKDQQDGKYKIDL